MKIKHKTRHVNWKVGCTGKIRHDNVRFAKQHLEFCQAQEPDKQYHVYRCRACGAFHVGTVLWGREKKAAAA